MSRRSLSFEMRFDVAQGQYLISSENRMASKCPQCGNDHITALQPSKRDHETVEFGNSINDARQVLLVCGACGYLGPQAPGAEEPAELRLELDDSR
jgi:predicted RNA-binding Zn-ribbon protein involved in translation (DUF1610 family)